MVRDILINLALLPLAIFGIQVSIHFIQVSINFIQVSINFIIELFKKD